MANPHKRSESPTPSHLSVKTDNSRNESPNVSCESSDSGDLRSESPTPSHLSVKTDNSRNEPLNLSCASSDSGDLSSCGEGMLPTSDNSKIHKKRKRSRTYLSQQHQQKMTTTADSPIKKRKHIDDSISEVLISHKATLKRTFEQISEGIIKSGCPTYVNKIYTDLYITEGESGGVNKEHEIWQIEAALSSPNTESRPISCNDIFKPISGTQRSCRIVLTKGIAGIGKTVSVQKFILDWSDGKANTDLDIIFAVPFRALNLVKDKKFNLRELLLAFHPELEKLLDAEEYQKCKLLFILDGLDESRLSLKFQEEAMLHSDRQTSTVDMLISSLIKGTLLPSSLIWITSRPAAASQIPLQYINLFTEVVGFNDRHKEEYFMKRIDDPSQAQKIITHIKASRSLHIMCHMPVFCCISATVLQQILVNADGNQVPRTLTEMYTHFLLIQTNIKNHKYHDGIETDCHDLLETHKGMILRLAELAFKHLQTGNLMFYENDLKESGIDINDASVYSGMCTEIFKQESVFVKEKVYCFVHLSIQEFLAALHIFHSYVSKDMDKLNHFLARKSASMHDLTLDEFLKIAVNKALESRNGHLDLFVRFLHGFALESTQKLLQGILPNPTCNHNSINKAIRNLKHMQRPNISPERCINLLHCLDEMNDSSIQDDIHRLLKSGKGSNKQLTLAHCSALAYLLLGSEKVLEEFNLSEYKTSEEGRRRLIPAVRSCKKALLAGCKLTDEAYESVASALQCPNSPLRELDLRKNGLHNSAENLLCVSLKSSNCNLETLRLSGCKLSQESCRFLTSALQSPNSHLSELDLSNNDLRSSIKDMVCVGLMSEHCRLQIFRVSGCNLTEVSCEMIATLLKRENSHLKELDISHNDLQDAGIELLCPGLQSPHCKVEVLRLSACLISEKGSFILASVVEAHAQLRELDVQNNHLGDAGVMLLTAKQRDPVCKLELLNVNNCSEQWLKPGPQKYVCELTLDSNTASRHLALSKRNQKATYVNRRQPYPDHPDRFTDCPVVLCKEGLSGQHYWEVVWGGSGVRIGATYKDIKRKGAKGLDGSVTAWCMECCTERFTVQHANWTQTIPHRSGSASRVGVYLDWPAGTLSFFSVCSDTIKLLHTFDAIFAEALYPAFYVASESSVELC